MTARMEGDFCIFLIGMRINRPLKLHKWIPVIRAMPKMIAELEAHPELGYLGGSFWLARTIISLQYWRSFEALTSYATSRDRVHLPAWQAFTRSIGDSGDVGIWHETYLVKGGAYETIYHNMPPFGLGKVGELIPASGHRRSATGRVSSPS